VPPSAATDYAARLQARRATRAALDEVDARLAHGRLATFGASVVLVALAWQGVVSGWILLAPLLVFLWLIRAHARALDARALADRAVEFYERGLARIEDRWAGTGETGDRFRNPTHVYADDLDLFGRGSLFELLSLARTRSGEAMLAGWLMSPADAGEIRARQEAVDELSTAVDLREGLAVAGADVRARVQTDRLLEWAESPPASRPALAGVIWSFTGATILGSFYLIVTGAWWPLLAITVVHALVLRAFRHDIDAMLSAREPGTNASFVADDLTHRARDLDVLAEILRLLESTRFNGHRLAGLHERLSADGVPVSRAIRRVHRLSDLHDSLTNVALIPLALFLLGGVTGQTWILQLSLVVSALLLLLRPHLALAIERWRARHGRRVRGWLQTIAEFEALSSLGGYRYEHPEDPFPEIIVTAPHAQEGATLEGIGLGHPLLPRTTMVRNDVRLAGATRLLVVSGSNMSGKSTLLRTIGINTALALAGAPVRAVSFRLTPVAIGATLRIQDSLLEGRSRFYAEITRLRALADLAAGPTPLLFLLDELFHGTNSHDRLIGAQGVLASLLDRGAIGVITTHDLALTAIADGLSPRAVNVHFEDWFDAGEMVFDYRMKAGPVTRSNALALMRAVGLDVREEV
jgi:hypothetical protein